MLTPPLNTHTSRGRTFDWGLFTCMMGVVIVGLLVVAVCGPVDPICTSRSGLQSVCSPDAVFSTPHQRQQAIQKPVFVSEPRPTATPQQTMPPRHAIWTPCDEQFAGVLDDGPPRFDHSFAGGTCRRSARSRSGMAVQAADRFISDFWACVHGGFFTNAVLDQLVIHRVDAEPLSPARSVGSRPNRLQAK